MIALTSILVPTDFSETSAVAVRYGVALARAFHARLCLLHVMSDELSLEVAAPLNLGLLDDLQNDARERLDKSLAEQQGHDVASESVLRKGAADVEILQYAREHEIDLIVMGTDRHSGIAHLLTSGVVEKVVRKAPCPVLVVRHPEHEFVVPDAGARQPEQPNA